MIAFPIKGLSGNGFQIDEHKPAGYCCPLCGGLGEHFCERDGYALRECRNGHAPVLLSWQWASIAEYEALYTEPERYHVIMQVDEGQKTSWERDADHLKASYARLQFLQAIKPTGTLLDIGAGTGAFVAMAAALGYLAEGLEPSNLACEGWNLGRNLCMGQWRQMHRGDPDALGYVEHSKYDVVTMHDVWEHLANPVECLHHLVSWLADDGLLVIEIPEWNCPQARVQGARWRHVRPLQHIWLPSDGAARSLFQCADLRVDALIRPLRGTLGKITYFLSRA